MIVSLIVAMDRRGGIGLNNKLPWHLPADLKRFKELTMGHHLIVGRKTWQSIGRALAGRMMIVVTRDPQFEAQGITIVHSLTDALRTAENAGEGEAFIGGGAEIYRQSLDFADRIYLTLVDGEFEADTYFPKIRTDQWTEVSAEHSPGDDRNAYPCTFKILERTQNV